MSNQVKIRDAASETRTESADDCCLKRQFMFVRFETNAIWVCLKMLGILWYIPNEIAIFHRDNDQQNIINHWVQWATQHFQTHPFDGFQTSKGGQV